jgi:hypothetical protein
MMEIITEKNIKIYLTEPEARWLKKIINNFSAINDDNEFEKNVRETMYYDLSRELDE